MPPLRRENRQGTHLLGIVAIVGVVILTTSAANSRLHLTEKLLAGGLPISSNTEVDGRVGVHPFNNTNHHYYVFSEIPEGRTGFLEADDATSQPTTEKTEPDSSDKPKEGNTEKKTDDKAAKEPQLVTTTTTTTPINTDPSKQYHVVMTAGGGHFYNTWQSRICYYWYRRVKAEDKHGAMGGFTRILHTGKEDQWMDEIPTIVVSPLPPELEKIAQGYIVLNRPYAFLQFAEKHLANIKEEYIFMAEPDHIFLAAPPLLASPTKAAAYHFSYMEPKKAEYKEIVARHNKKNVPIDKFAPIGNSPVMIHKSQFAQVVPIWYNMSIELKQDAEADKAWGWIVEMYAYLIASTQLESGPIEYELIRELMVQPPFDYHTTIGDKEHEKQAYIVHFTYGQDTDASGKITYGTRGAWHWDKRDYYGGYPPIEKMTQPPEGCKNEALKTLMAKLKEAAENLPAWGTARRRWRRLFF